MSTGGRSTGHGPLNEAELGRPFLPFPLSLSGISAITPSLLPHFHRPRTGHPPTCQAASKALLAGDLPGAHGTESIAAAPVPIPPAASQISQSGVSRDAAPALANSSGVSRGTTLRRQPVEGELCAGSWERLPERGGMHLRTGERVGLREPGQPLHRRRHWPESQECDEPGPEPEPGVPGRHGHAPTPCQVRPCSRGC